jgi:hypothetical protein
MEDERIQELMLELWENLELDLDEEERQDEGEPSVDIGEAPVAATGSDLILTENGLVKEETVITAFTTDLLGAPTSEGMRHDCSLILNSPARRNVSRRAGDDTVIMTKDLPIEELTMKWHCVEPGHHASDAGWHIERHEGYLYDHNVRIEQWWNPYAPNENRGGPVWKSFRTLKEAKAYADEQGAESGVPYEWGNDAEGDLWTVGTPFVFQIKNADNGCYRLVYCNDDDKELGVFPTVKKAKEAAEEYVPAVV